MFDALNVQPKADTCMCVGCELAGHTLSVRRTINTWWLLTAWAILSHLWYHDLVRSLMRKCLLHMCVNTAWCLTFAYTCGGRALCMSEWFLVCHAWPAPSTMCSISLWMIELQVCTWVKLGMLKSCHACFMHPCCMFSGSHRGRVSWQPCQHHTSKHGWQHACARVAGSLKHHIVYTCMWLLLHIVCA